MSDNTINILCWVIPSLAIVAGIGLWFLEQAAQEAEMYDRLKKKKQPNVGDEPRRAERK